MRVLFLSLEKMNTINEASIYSDLLRTFKNHGHSVTIISPLEKRYGEDTSFEEKDGVSYLKVRIGNITKSHKIEKGIATLSIQKHYIEAIRKYLVDRNFDLIIYTTPPITFYKVIRFLKARYHATTYLLLKDIFPQNAVDLGMFSKKSLFYAYFRHVEKKLYGISDYIGTMSEANKSYLIANNPKIRREKIEINPNTIIPYLTCLTDDRRVALRDKYGLPYDKKIFLYGGNLGLPQSIDFIIEVIKENEHNENAFIFIVGDGTEYKKLHTFFSNNKVVNARLLNRLPKEEYELLAQIADVGLIFLNYNFTIPNFPSRILSYMNAKIPVLSVTDPNTDVGHVIQSGNFGRSILSNDPKAVAQMMSEMCDMDLKQMGANAYNYLEEHYHSEVSYNTIMSHF